MPSVDATPLRYHSSVQARLRASRADHLTPALREVPAASTGAFSSAASGHPA